MQEQKLRQPFSQKSSFPADALGAICNLIYFKYGGSQLTKKQIAVLASRILAIVCFIKAITLTQVVGFQIGANAQLSMSGRAITTMSTFLPILLLIIFALFLWLFAEGLSEYMIPEDKEELTLSFSGEDLQVIGFSILGLFVLTRGLPEFTHNLLNYYLIEKQNPFYDGISLRYIIQLIAGFLEVVIGFILLFGAKGLSGLVKTFRSAGVNNKED